MSCLSCEVTAIKEFISSPCSVVPISVTLYILVAQNSYINNPEFAELPSGSSHGVGSAAGMARLHGILANGGITVAGRRLLSESMIQTLQIPLSMGPEKLFGIDLFYSYGMELLPVLEGEKVFMRQIESCVI